MKPPTKKRQLFFIQSRLLVNDDDSNDADVDVDSNDDNSNDDATVDDDVASR